jgi:hypothetical protein
LCSEQRSAAKELANRKETAEERPDHEEKVAACAIGTEGVEEQDEAALHQVPQVQPPAQQLRRESRSALEIVFVGLHGCVNAVIGI